MPGPVFKTGEGSGNRLLVGSIPIRSRLQHKDLRHSHRIRPCPSDVGLDAQSDRAKAIRRLGLVQGVARGEHQMPWKDEEQAALDELTKQLGR